MNQQSTKIRNALLLTGLLAICLTAVVVSTVMLTRTSTEYNEGEQAYEELAKYLIPPTPKPGTPVPPEPEPDTWPAVDFDALRTINSDIVAWIICEDTQINYPVVQGADNDYYLRRLFDGKRNGAGCLFVDAGNEPGFVDHNTAIYGHNMKNKTMFSVLMNYKTQEYYEQHPQMILLTPDARYTVDLIAGYVANTREDSWQLWFNSNAEFEEWISDTRQKSTFNSTVETSTSDRFITLSTCSNEFDDARYVVVGKLIQIP